MRAFRQAAPAPAAWNLAKTLAQTIVFWGVFLAVLPMLIRWAEQALGVPAFVFAGQRVTGVVLFAVFGSLGLWSGATMASLGHGTPLPLDAPRDLVVRGPYAFLRNPMAVAGLGQGTAVGLGLGSPLVLLYVLAGGLLWHIAVRPLEEADLAQRFGAGYERYRREVRCWVPRTHAYRARAETPARATGRGAGK